MRHHSIEIASPDIMSGKSFIVIASEFGSSKQEARRRDSAYPEYASIAGLRLAAFHYFWSIGSMGWM
jgi:hypothetical protein